ncbi:hypothetical protein [Dokdonia sp. R78006]|uniref:hypothetical protein n=1 Tax=Dokdonia sp. R78006 TaxID=3093866 RepID=UPI0036D21E20
MKLRYKKKKLIIYAVIAIVWSVLGIISFIENENNFMKYSYLVLGVMHIIIFIMYQYQGYANITDDVLIVGELKKKRISIDQLIKINHAAGDFVLVSETNKVSLSKDQVREEDWKEFIAIPKIKALDPHQQDS